MEEKKSSLHEEMTMDKALDIMHSLGAAFGNAVERFGRMNLKITFKGDEDYDLWFKDGEPVEPEVYPKDDDPNGDIKENESASAQIAQILTMLSPEFKAVFGSSAIYDILSRAVSIFGGKGKTLEERIDGMVFRDACLAWICAKRVFAVNHSKDLLKMINAILEHWDGFPEGFSLNLAPATDRDKKSITEFCKIVYPREWVTTKKSHTVSTPTSLAFWSQPEAAATPKSKKTERKSPYKIPGVYNKPKRVDIITSISDLNGNPIELTGFDLVVQAAVGKLYRENKKDNSVYVKLTPAQIFRECGGLDPDATVAPSSIKQTIDSINKQRQTISSIYYAEQLEAFLSDGRSQREGFDYSAQFIDGPLISADRQRTAHVVQNGRVVDDVFVFNRAPIFEHYSYGFNQDLVIDRKYISGALNKVTPENISFARYLCNQINGMKTNESKKKGYNTIHFDTIAKNCVIDIQSRSARRNFQAKVFDYCENLVAMGLIKKVEPVYKGRVYIGIKFTV